MKRAIKSVLQFLLILFIITIVLSNSNIGNLKEKTKFATNKLAKEKIYYSFTEHQVLLRIGLQ